jgi:hypothetical protein
MAGMLVSNPRAKAEEEGLDIRRRDANRASNVDAAKLAALDEPIDRSATDAQHALHFKN